MENTAEKVRKRAAEMTEAKTKQLLEIRQKQDELRGDLERAEAAVKEATEKMDLDAFEKAKEAKSKAETGLDMYGRRYEQLRRQEMISEKESDEVIKSLLDYEDSLETEFKQAILAPLEALADLTREYRAAIQEAESTIKLWEQDIHANYRSETATFAETGTNRSPRPIPVHPIAYIGCGEAERIHIFLEAWGIK